jgi:cytochrome c2
VKPHPIAAVLLAPLLIGLAACSAEPASSDGTVGGAKLFQVNGCVLCHLADGSGSQMGPPLRNLSANWTREELATYLADPRGWLEHDERLRGLKQRFRMEMPAVSLSEEDRLTLADHLLEL